MVNDDVAVVIVTFGSKTHATYLESRYEPESKPAKTVTLLAPPPKPSEKPDPQPDLQPQQPKKRPAVPLHELPEGTRLKLVTKNVLLGLQIAAVGATILFGVLWRLELAERKKLRDEIEKISKNLTQREADLTNETNKAVQSRTQLQEKERHLAQVKEDFNRIKAASASRPTLVEEKKESSKLKEEIKQLKIELEKQRKASTAAILSKFDELNNFLQEKAKDSSGTAKEAIRLFEKAKALINEIPQEKQPISPPEPECPPATAPAIPTTPPPVTPSTQPPPPLPANPAPEKN